MFLIGVSIWFNRMTLLLLTKVFLIIKFLKSQASTCKKTTILSWNNVCSSGCVFLFMIGDTREAHPASLFGFHSAYFGPIKLKRLGFSKHLEYGVNRQWLEDHAHYFATKEMTYVKAEDLEGSNIVTNLD